MAFSALFFFSLHIFSSGGLTVFLDSQTTPFLFMSCSVGKRVADIYMGRHGTSCAAPTCFPQSSGTFHGKTSALESDKLICRQSIVIMAFHYSETVSLSYKTNKVHLKDISHIMHGQDSRPPYSWQCVIREFQSKE